MGPSDSGEWHRTRRSAIATRFTAEQRAERMARTPMGIEPGAQAIADTVAFLVDGPDALTGVVLLVDGGMSATW